MSRVIAEISMSLDGYVAGPDASMEEPLGIGGEELHRWAFTTRTFLEQHGREGGETGIDDDVMAEAFAGAGASIMGRKMFSGGDGPWESDENANGWWGEEPPFGHPVFVLTHHEREPLKLGNTEFTFVTDGNDAPEIRARGEPAGARRLALRGRLSLAVAAGKREPGRRLSHIPSARARSPSWSAGRCRSSSGTSTALWMAP